MMTTMLDLLTYYNFDIKYKSGYTNIVANALSRKPELANITTISVELSTNR